MAAPFILDVNLRIKDILGLEKFKNALSTTSAAIGVGGGAVSATTKGAAVTGGSAIMPANVASQTVNNLEKITAAAPKATKAVKDTGTAMTNAGKKASSFSQRVGLAGARYSAFIAATAVPFLLINQFKKATEAVIEFDSVMIKMSQILDTSKANLSDMGADMIKLSVDTGTSLGEIAKATKILAQSGKLRKPGEFEAFLEPLAKIPLLASFESIDQATEGVIATMNQFGETAGSATDILDRFDHVSNNFAVTASDLVEGVKRGGGAFAALGGNINEFIALMTTMRSVTRENASTIGTSIRTITARMARPRTLKFLEGLGVEIRDADGELLGMIQILNNLNDVFQRSGTEGKAAIAEQLGGFRQISRVLAAVQNPEMIQRALKFSESASGSITRNSEKGLQSVSVQLKILGAKWMQFIQLMAEPIFIPLVKGATGLAEKLIQLATVLGPVLPMFVELIGFTAGIYGLAKAISLIGPALGLISKMGAGVSGAMAAFGGGGAARAAADRQRMLTRLGGGIGGAGVVAGGGAIAGAMKGQVGQLIGVAALAAAFKYAGDAAKETGHETLALGLEMSKTIAIMIALASMLSGKTVSGLLKGVGGYIGGGVAAGGIAGYGGAALGVAGIGAGLMVAGGMVAEKRAAINIDKLVKNAADYINNLDIEITDEESMIQVGGEIGKKMLETIQRAAQEYEGVIGFIAAFGKRMGSLLSSLGSLVGFSEADWSGITGAIVDEDRIKKMFEEMYEKSPETFRDILDQAIVESGPEWRKAIEKSFMSMIPGVSPEVGTMFRKLLTDVVGGGELSVEMKVARQQRLAAQQALINEQKNMAIELSKIIIPTQISSELDQLSTAIRKVSQEIGATVGTFEDLSSKVGTIAAPNLPTEISEEAIRERLATRGLGEMLSDLDFGEIQGVDAIGEAGQTWIQISKLADNLIQSLTSTEAMTRNQTNLDDVRQYASKASDNALEIFFANMTDVDPKFEGQVRAVARQITQSWIEAVEDGTPVTAKAMKEKIEESMKRTMSAFQLPTEQLVTELKTLTDQILQLKQARMSGEAARANIWAGGTTTTPSLVEEWNEALNQIGIKNVPGSYGNAEEALRNFVNQGYNIVDMADEIIRIEQQRAIAEKEYRLALQDGSMGAGKAHDKVSDLSYKLYDLQQAMGMVAEIANRAKQALQEETQEEIRRLQEWGKEHPESKGVEGDIKYQEDLLKQQLTRLDRMVEYSQREAKVGQFDAIVEGAELYAKASEIFSSAVDKFQKAVLDLSRPMTATDVPGAQGPPSFETEKELAIKQADKDLQAFGVTAEQAERGMAAALEQQKDLAYNAKNAAVFLGNVAKVAFGDLVSGESVPIKSMLKMEYSADQIKAASELFAKVIKARTGKEARGAGGELNQENIAKNIAAMYEKGLDSARKTAEFTKESQQHLENLATQRAMEAEAVKPEPTLDKPQQEKLLPVEIDFTNLDDQIGAAIPKDGIPLLIPPQFAGLATAMVANAIAMPANTGAIETKRATVEMGLDTNLNENPTIAEERIDVDGIKVSASDIRLSAENIKMAGEIFNEATNRFALANENNIISNDNFVMGVENFKIGIENMVAATDVMRGVADTMITIVDMQKQSQINAADIEVGGTTAESSIINDQMASSIEALGDRIDSIKLAIETQTQSQVESRLEDKKEPMLIEGLDANTDALASSTEITANVNTGIKELNNQLAVTTEKIAEGVDMELETVSTITVDVQGVADAAKEFTAEFKAVAEKVCKQQINVVLSQLATAAGNADDARNFEGAMV